MRTTKQDEELTLLLTKLYTIQEQVGAKDPSSSSDKRSRAEQAGQQLQQQSAMMGRTRKSKRVGSRFLELKSSIVEHLRTVHTLIEAQNNSKNLNPKEVIAAQAEIREVIRQASDEWAEINELYKNEARKKKSKFTPEELEVQQALVMQLKAEIDKVKEGQLAAHARGGVAEQQNVQLNLSALAALDAADFSTESGGGNDMSKSWTTGGGGGTAITMSQQLQLEQIRHRDAEFDTELDEIGEGIQDLRELALRQGEEVRRQNVMLTNTASRIDDAHEHMTNVNAKMKETLKEVGRSSDKLCVDIMCILLAVGFAGIFYKMSKGEF